jgi:hypothetical protein
MKFDNGNYGMSYYDCKKVANMYKLQMIIIDVKHARNDLMLSSTL